MSQEQEKSHAEFALLVEQALTLPPANRLAWLATRAGVTDVDNARRLLRLGETGRFAPTSIGIARDSLVGTAVGPYRLIARLGGGGFGTVYRAQRCDGQFEQTVAIKVLATGASSLRVQRQFERERQLLAALNHPNIAALQDGGTTDDGVAYAVMEYVDGVSLEDYLAQSTPDAETVLTIFVTLCAAVQAAHEALVIHRDIKPANILISADGNPVLVDFGIASCADVADPASPTLLGAMTPAYASPEQLRGDRLTTASDVYALGVVLYEALTGVRPFDVDGLSPGKQLSRLEQHVATAPGAHGGRRVRHQPDLDAVVLKALAAAPAQRYASAAALGRDLQRVLARQPVAAKAPTRAYRFWRFISRNRVAAVGTAVAAVAAVTGLALSLWQIGVAQAQTRAAHAQLQRAEVVSAFLGDVLTDGGGPWEAPGPRGNATTSVGDVLLKAETRLDTALSEYPELRIELMTRLSEAYLWLSEAEHAAELMFEAIEVADRLLPAASPLRVDTRYHLATAFLDEDMIPEALGFYEDALAVAAEQGTLGSVRWVYIVIDMAIANSNMGNFERALQLHLAGEQRWFELAGDEPAAAWAEGFQARAYYEFSLGDLAAARRSLDRALLAIDRFGDATRFTWAATYDLAGRLAYHEGDTAQAREHLERAFSAARVHLQEYDESFPLLETGSQLAIVLCESDGVARATGILDELAVMLPNHIQLGDGWIYHQARAECANARGQFDAALAHVAEAQRLGRFWPYSIVHVARRQAAMAVSYAGLGDVERARRADEASRALFEVWRAPR